jgi:hypothetical protein
MTEVIVILVRLLGGGRPAFKVVPGRPTFCLRCLGVRLAMVFFAELAGLRLVLDVRIYNLDFLFLIPRSRPQGACCV